MAIKNSGRYSAIVNVQRLTDAKLLRTTPKAYQLEVSVRLWDLGVSFHEKPNPVRLAVWFPEACVHSEYGGQQYAVLRSFIQRKEEELAREHGKRLVELCVGPVTQIRVPGTHVRMRHGGSWR